MKYFSLKVICEDHDAIKHGQAYVVGKTDHTVCCAEAVVLLIDALFISLCTQSGPP